MSVLAVVEPNGLAGTELRRVLRERRELWTEVRLLSAEADDEVATLSEFDGAALVRPLSAEQLAGVDLVFLCEGYDEAAPAWQLAGAGTTTVLISPERSPAGGVAVVAGVNSEAAAAGGLLVSPHPAVVLLALLLDPLRPLGLADAAAWLVQPATMRGRRGLDELMEQTRALLAFSDDRPTEVFGDQLTFNLLPTDGDTAPLAAQVAGLLGGSPTPAIELIQGGVFHGFTASLLVEFTEDPGAEAIAAALAAQPLLEPHDPKAGAGPGPVLAAGRDNVLLGPVSPATGAPATGTPGRYWLRAVMDNLTRGGAVNAIEIAAAVLPRPS